MGDKKLNPKERAFVLAYISNGRNATRAYAKVFPRVKDNSAASKGSLWLRKDNVSREIDRLTQEAFKKEHMTAAEALARMAQLARSDVGALIWRPGELDSAGNATPEGTVKPIWEMPEAVRCCIKSFKFDILGRPEFVFWDKPSQLANVGKNLKLLNESVDVNVQVGFADRLRRAREKRLANKK